MKVPVLAAAVCLVSWRSAGEMTTDNYTGYAYNDSHNLLYTEEFTDRFEDGKHFETLTDYFNPEHKRIAHRLLDSPKSRFAPDFETEDLRSGYLEGAVIVGEQVR